MDLYTVCIEIISCWKHMVDWIAKTGSFTAGSLVAEMQKQTDLHDSPPPPPTFFFGGVLDTSVFHAWPEVFKTYPNKDLPFRGKTPLNKNFAWFCTKFFPFETRFFWEHLLWYGRVWKLTSKHPLIDSVLFFLKTGTYMLTPSHDSCESHSIPKSNPFFFRVSLVPHVYNIIWFECPSSPPCCLATSFLTQIV